MNLKNSLLLLIFLTAIIQGVYAMEPNFHCSKQEEWKWSKNSLIEKSDFENFSETLDEDRSLKEVLSESQVFLSKKPKDAFTKKFYEYWIARGLQIHGFPHLAVQYFQKVLSSPAQEETAPIYGAALSCLNQLTQQTPSLSFKISLKNIPVYFSDKFQAQVQEMAAFQLREKILSQKGLTLTSLQKSEEFQKIQDSELYKNWILGLFAASRGQSKDVTSSLEKFLVEFKKTPRKSAVILRNSDATRLLLARAYYEQKNFDEAQRVYQDIRNASNQLPEKLVELGWSYLQGKNYSQAIGVSSQLHESSLRVSFIPDSWSILAMSLNELCQFPMAKNIVGQFYSDYYEASMWLKNFPKKVSYSLYETTAQYVGQHTNLRNIPIKILTEWTRTSGFANAQTEIQSIFQQVKSIEAVLASGSVENEKKFFTIALQRLKERQSVLARGIESALRARTLEMKNELNKVSETMQLVQVEINTGASHDMIFQNANEEYNEGIRKNKFAQKFSAQNKMPIWNWGNAKRNSGNTEMWDDEIGALRSKLGNLCEVQEEFKKKASISKK